MVLNECCPLSKCNLSSTCNLRSILVRTTRCQIHPATCTRPWRASFRIAWVLCQLGSLHNVKKSTSAMSEITYIKISLYAPQGIFIFSYCCPIFCLFASFQIFKKRHPFFLKFAIFLKGVLKNTSEKTSDTFRIELRIRPSRSKHPCLTHTEAEVTSFTRTLKNTSQFI